LSACYSSAGNLANGNSRADLLTEWWTERGLRFARSAHVSGLQSGRARLSIDWRQWTRCMCDPRPIHSLSIHIRDRNRCLPVEHAIRHALRSHSAADETRPEVLTVRVIVEQQNKKPPLTTVQKPTPTLLGRPTYVNSRAASSGNASLITHISCFFCAS